MFAAQIGLGERPSADDWIGPWLGTDGMPDLADDEGPGFSFPARTVKVLKLGMKGTEAEESLDWAVVYVTSHRLVWIVRGWQGRSWEGQGLFGELAAGALNARARRSAQRAAVEIAIAGQVRYDWITQVAERQAGSAKRPQPVIELDTVDDDVTHIYRYTFLCDPGHSAWILEQLLPLWRSRLETVISTALPPEHPRRAEEIPASLSPVIPELVSAQVAPLVPYGRHLQAFADPELPIISRYAPGPPPGYRRSETPETG